MEINFEQFADADLFPFYRGLQRIELHCSSTLGLLEVLTDYSRLLQCTILATGDVDHLDC